jgi:hypothetical protein
MSLFIWGISVKICFILFSSYHVVDISAPFGGVKQSGSYTNFFLMALKFAYLCAQKHQPYLLDDRNWARRWNLRTVALLGGEDGGAKDLNGV